jgi:predicted dehydrogenase
VGFLGTGYIADWHAQAIAKVPGVELVAVCDHLRNKAEALALKVGGAAIYQSLEAMLAQEQLDAVHVLLPPNAHFEAARVVLEAGVDVFMEKPMCVRAAECDELVRLAAERGRRLGVGQNFLFSEQYEQLRRDLRSGVLGKIDSITITWHRSLPPIQFGPFNAWMLRDPRNILLEIGSHSAAHMLDLVGAPESIEVHPSNPVELPTGRKFYRRWQAVLLCPGICRIRDPRAGFARVGYGGLRAQHIFPLAARPARSRFRRLRHGFAPGAKPYPAGAPDPAALLSLQA